MSLPALWDQLPARFGRAGLLDNFPVAASQAILAQLIPAGDAVEVEFDSADGVVDCSRADKSRAALAASAVKDWQRCRSVLSRYFTPVSGFDAIARINVLDGVRIYFRNGDIAHIRPSGNAPQLTDLRGQRHASARGSDRRALAARTRRNSAPAGTRFHVSDGGDGCVCQETPSVPRVFHQENSRSARRVRRPAARLHPPSLKTQNGCPRGLRRESLPNLCRFNSGSKIRDNPGSFCRQHFFFDSSYRQNQAAQTDLTGHRHIFADAPSGQQ